MLISIYRVLFSHTLLQKVAGVAKALGGSGQGKEVLYASTSSYQSGVVNEVPFLRFCIIEGAVLDQNICCSTSGQLEDLHSNSCTLNYIQILIRFSIYQKHQTFLKV